MLKEEDVQTEYPCDVDDEYIAENGFQPILPGEYTRLSSALALFRLTRILARILEKNYPSVVNYELSLRQMSSLELELNAWYENLPTHLRLKFSQDKPSTDITSSRSPILVSYNLKLQAFTRADAGFLFPLLFFFLVLLRTR